MRPSVSSPELGVSIALRPRSTATPDAGQRSLDRSPENRERYDYGPPDRRAPRRTGTSSVHPANIAAGWQCLASADPREARPVVPGGAAQVQMQSITRYMRPRSNP